MGHADSERMANTLTWQSAVRADLRVAEGLLDGEEPDGIYGISHARVVDHFLLYIE